MTLARLKTRAHIAPPMEIVREGDYRTDGRRLFRVGKPCGVGERPLIEVEDCRTYDVWLLTTAEVSRLAVVRPASGRAAA